MKREENKFIIWIYLNSQIWILNSWNRVVIKLCSWDLGIAQFPVLGNFPGHHLQFHFSDCSPCTPHLLGTNVHEAQNILNNSGLPITSAVDLEDAAKKSVACVAKKW